MRTPIIAGNWKMNLLRSDAQSLAARLRERLSEVDAVELVVCPTFTSLDTVAETLAGSAIDLGGQNCFHEDDGAYTGEIAPSMLLDAGCTWVILGHSERRRYFGEDEPLLNAKVRFALEKGLRVMYCIGETLEERESGKIDEVLRRQVRDGLANVPRDRLDRLVIAYEPVWAIGTGRTATPDQAQDAHRFVRELIAHQFDASAADALRIQYGGSVKPDNAAELLAQPDIDGALVGGASLDVESFTAIVQAAPVGAV